MSLIFHKILVPTDFSETADTAVYYAKELARQYGAELHLMHVVEDPMLLAGWPDLSPGPLTERPEDPALRKQLEELIAPADRANLRVGVHIVPGSPASSIARYALDGEFELVVMGTHGRGAVTHALLGSVAEHVVRTAPCPVLTIRHPSHRTVMPGVPAYVTAVPETL